MTFACRRNALRMLAALLRSPQRGLLHRRKRRRQQARRLADRTGAMRIQAESAEHHPDICLVGSCVAERFGERRLSGTLIAGEKKERRPIPEKLVEPEFPVMIFRAPRRETVRIKKERGFLEHSDGMLSFIGGASCDGPGARCQNDSECC
jgi:hypothetical protein